MTSCYNSFTNWFVRKFSVYILQRFPPNLQYVATLACEIRKSKNVTEFSRWTWQSIYLKVNVRCCIICYKNIALMILLKYVYNVRNEDGAKIIVVKNHHDATTFNWTTFNCWFETSSHLTNYKMLVSQWQQSWDSLFNYS